MATSSHTPFTVNAAHRISPYSNFNFQIKWGADPNPVMGLSKMSALKRTTEVIEWREAGASNVITRLPGRTKFEPVTFESGVTHNTRWLEWADLVNSDQGNPAASLRWYRQELTVEMLNYQGTAVKSFVLHNAWVSEWQPMGELDANANAVAIQSMKVEYEGFHLTDNEPAEY